METTVTNRRQKLIIKKCHICGHLNDSFEELQNCNKCNKAFLPLNYFIKVHEDDSLKFSELFADSTDLHEEDIIKGIYVLW